MIGRNRDLSLQRERIELPVRSMEPVRLDLYLRENLVWKSRHRLQALIRAGRITVNGDLAKPSRAVRSGDRIEIRLSDGTGFPVDYDARELRIIYEDPWLLAIDKPADLIVHPVGKHVYDTLLNYLHHRYRDRPAEIGAGGAEQGNGRAEDGESGAGEERTGGSSGRERARRRHEARIDESAAPCLCHRIDKDTTGILLVAKDGWIRARVGEQFENRLVSKEYLALAEGRVAGSSGEIDLPIGEGKNLPEALSPPVKPARTLLRVLERFATPGGEFTLVAARPVTGRQNQIRVHLAAAGHPIAGDTRYGGARREGFPARYLLHAARLRFYHPRMQMEMDIVAEAPEDFRGLLDRLRGKKSEVGGGKSEV